MAIQLYTAIHYTAIQRYTVYMLYIIPLEGPTLATLVRPRGAKTFFNGQRGIYSCYRLKYVCVLYRGWRCYTFLQKRASVSGETPGLAALVGHEGRRATLAGLVPVSHLRPGAR